MQRVWKCESREETFTALGVPMPTTKEVKETGCVPAIQKLSEERLKFYERMLAELRHLPKEDSSRKVE